MHPHVLAAMCAQSTGKEASTLAGFVLDGLFVRLRRGGAVVARCSGA